MHLKLYIPKKLPTCSKCAFICSFENLWSAISIFQKFWEKTRWLVALVKNLWFRRKDILLLKKNNEPNFPAKIFFSSCWQQNTYVKHTKLLCVLKYQMKHWKMLKKFFMQLWYGKTIKMKIRRHFSNNWQALNFRGALHNFSFNLKLLKCICAENKEGICLFSGLHVYTRWFSFLITLFAIN